MRDEDLLGGAMLVSLAAGVFGTVLYYRSEELQVPPLPPPHRTSTPKPEPVPVLAKGFYECAYRLSDDEIARANERCAREGYEGRANDTGSVVHCYSPSLNWKRVWTADSLDLDAKDLSYEGYTRGSLGWDPIAATYIGQRACTP